MREEAKPRHDHVLVALLLQTVVTVGFFMFGVAQNDSWQYDYFLWNLFLAWLPLIFAYTLVRYLKIGRWKSWKAIVLLLLWLGFLPNSFYLVSDFVHLGDTLRANPTFDVIMFAAFVVNGLTLGFASLYLIHHEIKKRLTAQQTAAIIAGILFLSGLAIYLGRIFRLNTWDVLVNPAGFIFGVSNPLINNQTRPEAFSTVIGYWLLLGSLYFTLWETAKYLKATQRA